MPFQIGPLEVIVVALIALVVLGPKRLPEAGKSLGRGIREFKGSITGGNNDDDDAVALPEPKPTTTTS
jgi:sec-independent protein translocase protein TatA